MIELLQSVLCEFPTAEMPAREALTALLTFGGRVALESRRASLAPFDCAIFDTLTNSESLRLDAAPDAATGDANLRVYVNLLGRLHLRPVAEAVLDYGLEDVVSVGYLPLRPPAIRQARAQADSHRREEIKLRESIDRALLDAENDGSLSGWLDDVEDSVRHVEAVCFYADDRLYAVMERITNLISTRKGSGLIGQLRQIPVADWRSSDRLAMVALRSLFLSGRSVRFEEFNSIELTARRFFQCLHKLGASYAAALQIPFMPPSHPLELGSQVGALAESPKAKSWVRYRRINGITFQKQEHCSQLVAEQKSEQIINASLDALRCRWSGNKAASPRDFFTQAAQDAIAMSRGAVAGNPPAQPPDAALSPLESLIEDIVVSAVRATGADYGMSSSLRRPGELLVDDLDALAAVVGTLRPKDFYCCIVGTERLQRRFGERLNGDVFRAVQARMQFNRWHFLPGNLPRRLVAADRHYFYPPVTPDIAEWVDQFHAGHARAAVRHCIRSPRPEIIEPPLQFGGQPFRGFYDVRVVRIDDRPFDLQDLTVVRAHSLWMGFVWRTIIASCSDPALASRLQIAGFANGQGAVIGSTERAAAD